MRGPLTCEAREGRQCSSSIAQMNSSESCSRRLFRISKSKHLVIVVPLSITCLFPVGSPVLHSCSLGPHPCISTLVAGCTLGENRKRQAVSNWSLLYTWITWRTKQEYGFLEQYSISMTVGSLCSSGYLNQIYICDKSQKSFNEHGLHKDSKGTASLCSRMRTKDHLLHS